MQRPVLWALASALIWVAGARSEVEIVAHRGASHDAPENTVAALKLAWEQGSDAAEFDVYLSKDDRIVAIHDKDTKRVAGVDRRVVDQTFDELRRLDVGSWKGLAFKDERVPTLTEMLKTVPKGKRVFIEIKCGPEIVPHLVKDLASAGLEPAQTAVIAFNPDVCEGVKKARPDLQVYWLADIHPRKKEPPTAEQLIAKAKGIGADGLDLSAGPNLTDVFARKVKQAGLKLYVWTVNDADLARRMIAVGVEGITTDRPQWLREKLAE